MIAPPEINGLFFLACAGCTIEQYRCHSPDTLVAFSHETKLYLSSPTVTSGRANDYI